MIDDNLRHLLATQIRLEMRPDQLSAADVVALGQVRDALGIRAAVALEVRRALRDILPVKPVKTPSRRRAS
jgi:hypothetical protein